jgi:hypothetical protein
MDAEPACRVTSQNDYCRRGDGSNIDQDIVIRLSGRCIDFTYQHVQLPGTTSLAGLYECMMDTLDVEECRLCYWS